MRQPSATRERPRSVTMQDVAEHLDVSKQTVSAVINNKPGIPEATRERVLAAIEELGYRPDYTARSLRTGRTRTIALFVTDISNPVFSKLASVAEDFAYVAHYTLALYNTRDDPLREQSYVDSAIQRSVDGALFVATRDDTVAVEILEAAGLPVVVMDRVPLTYAGPSVSLDNVLAGQLAARHLLSLGHTRLAHIAGPASMHISEERLLGFRSALEDERLPGPVLVERASGWQVECGYAAMQRLLHRAADFTAVLAAGDLLAIGAGRALREAGKQIPEDVSIIGIDDIDLAAFTHPPLTTISQGLAEMATRAARMLLDLLAGQEPEERRVKIVPQLVVRNSTAPPNGTGRAQ
jgi:LacI family transcriptional regulator